MFKAHMFVGRSGLGFAHVEADFTLRNFFTTVFTHFRKVPTSLPHQQWMARAGREGASSTLVSPSQKAIIPLLSLINQSTFHFQE